MQDDSLGASLLVYIIEQRCPDPPCVWRMNGEWWNECRRLITAGGRALILPPLHPSSEILLYGFPVEVTNEATVPELVPQGGTA